MEIRSMHFKANAATRLADVTLQGNLKKARGKFVDKRAEAITELDDFEGTRAAAASIRQRVIDHLDDWLERFERQAVATGATVLWARDGEEACRHIIDIARRHDVTKAVKSKSMLSEEAGLNQALEAAGIRPVETDLGEYILQINDNEPPSHIIAPVVHKGVDEVADLFAKVHGTPRKTDIAALTQEARGVLREHFLSAEMGISGGNFLVAETGSVALVTNEGNGRMVTTLPRVHVVLTGIEKVVPTLDDLATLMRLLPRSATGQSISNYVSLLTGTRVAGETEGPEKTVFILVDNGRAALAGSDFADMLRCIRCGACMNHCPVYFSLGGHAYGWVYPGPMGSVLTPWYTGIENALDLPHASTGCNQCGSVCPVNFPQPALMHRLREIQDERALRPWRERFALRAWGWLAAHPGPYRWLTRRAARYLRWLADESGRIRVLGLAPGWSDGRDLPAPPGRTFHELYAARKRA